MLAMAVVGGCARGEAAPSNGEGVVTRVVDGDTLHVRLGGTTEKVRLIGINTPETHGSGGLKECYGQEATKRMTQLAPVGTKVRLVRDVEARDRYGRLLAYVYRARDGLFLAVAMAKEGFADALSIKPNVAHAGEIAEAVEQARAANRGVWRHCGAAHVAI
jgi:micrococcal nuclease